MTAPKPKTPLPWDTAEVGVDECFLVVYEDNRDGWKHQIGEIGCMADGDYAAHAANAYPALVAALKDLAQRARDIGEDRIWEEDERIANEALKAAGEL